MSNYHSEQKNVMSLTDIDTDFVPQIHQPTISVVMPVYNVEAYIAEAIDSVLMQSFSDFELLIIDDQSPDNSIELIKSKYKDPRITILRQQNRGLAGARNTGIRYARGRYIAFLDSDDFWHANKLQCHMEQFTQHPNCGVSFSASMFVDVQSQPLNRIQSPRRKKNYTAGSVFTRNPIGNGSAPVIRKSVLEQIAFTGKDKHGQSVEYWQYFDESLKQSEDIDCWTRIALLSAADFHLIDQALTNYRVNNEGLSADVEAQFETWMRFVDKVSQYAPEFINRYGATAKAFQCRYLARRCISQAQGREAFRWTMRAFEYQPIALMKELGKTVSTCAVSVLLAILPKATQVRLVSVIL